ncbi:DNA replication complex GINS protein SLD5 [Balamuthia mandrillaris]
MEGPGASSSDGSAASEFPLFRSREETKGEEDVKGVSLNADMGLLRQAFINEVYAPEILAFQSEVVSRLKEQFEAQENNVAESTPQDGRDRLVHHILWMDLNRVKYLLAGYLRLRLEKICKYALFIERVSEIQSLLSANELEFFEKYVKQLHAHFEESFLRHLPEKVKHMEEEKMVVEPPLETNVVIRAKKSMDWQAEEDGDYITLEEGHFYTLQYASIRPLFEEGIVELV